MRKLNLDALQVESFVTSDAAPALRGTVRANAQIPGDTIIGPGTAVSECMVCDASVQISCIDTYDVRNCGETKYFDCTFGCTVRCSDPRLSCGPVCYIDDSTTRCAIE